MSLDIDIGKSSKDLQFNLGSSNFYAVKECESPVCLLHIIHNDTDFQHISPQS